MYATDNVIAEAKAEIMSVHQPKNMSAIKYIELLWEEALRCGRVYDELRLKGVFIE